MKTEQELIAELIKVFFPSEMLDYFEIVDFTIGSERVTVHLDERDKLMQAKEGHTYIKNGFLPESTISDFPARDKKMTLVVRRRRWRDEATGESVSNDYKLVAEGTRHSVEFAAFLKELIGYIPDRGIFA